MPQNETQLISLKEARKELGTIGDALTDNEVLELIHVLDLVADYHCKTLYSTDERKN